jgi:hypothetical protein
MKFGFVWRISLLRHYDIQARRQLACPTGAYGYELTRRAREKTRDTAGGPARSAA